MPYARAYSSRVGAQRRADIKAAGFASRAMRATITRRQRGYVRRVGYYRSNPGAPTNELSFRDLSYGVSAIPVGGVVLDNMVNITQGVGQSERLGRKAMIKSIMLRYQITLKANQGGSSAGMLPVCLTSN